MIADYVMLKKKERKHQRDVLLMEKVHTVLHVKAIDCPYDITQTGQAVPNMNQLELINALGRSREIAKQKAIATPFGFLVYADETQKNYSEECHLWFIDIENDYAITKLLIKNPSKKDDEPYRNKISEWKDVEMHPCFVAMFFNMMQLYAGDHFFSKQVSKLKDPHAQPLYAWESSVSSKNSTMGILESTHFINNILAVSKIPVIQVNFVLDSDECSFSFKVAKGEKEDKAKVPKDGSDLLEMLGLTELDATTLFERIKKPIEEADVITLSDFSLKFPLSWGMTKMILTHEVAHYVTFVYPTMYKINRGEEKINFKEYSILFAGHGALYCAIYLYLLWRFNVYPRNELYASFQQSGVPYFELDNLDVHHVNERLIDFVKSGRNS